jgi:hypothetical protein
MKNITYKILAQAKPAANTLVDIYTVPPGKEALLAHVHIFNCTERPTTFRFALSIHGAVVSPQAYLYYDAAIPGNSAAQSPPSGSITLAAGDVVRFSSASGECVIHLFGPEGDVGA